MVKNAALEPICTLKGKEKSFFVQVGGLKQAYPAVKTAGKG